MLSLTRRRGQALGAIGTSGESAVGSPGEVGRRANDIRTGNTPLEGGVNAVSGILRFSSITELEVYVRAMLELYANEYQRTTETIGELYRSMGDRASQGTATGSWEKVGSLFVDSTSVEKGEIDVAIQLLNDLKPKLTKTEEAVQGFRQLEEMRVPSSSTFLLYVRNGAPERIVVDPVNSHDGRFVFSDEYVLA
jgi:hypothetical protein